MACLRLSSDSTLYSPPHPTAYLDHHHIAIEGRSVPSPRLSQAHNLAALRELAPVTSPALPSHVKPLFGPLMVTATAGMAGATTAEAGSVPAAALDAACALAVAMPVRSWCGVSGAAGRRGREEGLWQGLRLETT
jgi:hypothetical protein